MPVDREKCLQMPHQINFLFLAFLLLIWPSGSRASDSREFLIQSLEKVESMQSFFEQTRSGSDEKFSGQLLFQKPNLFRMEIGPPVSQTILSDGDYLWVYDKDLEQVIVSHLTNSLSEMPFMRLLSEPRDFLMGSEIVNLSQNEKRFRISVKENENPLEFVDLDFTDGLISRVFVASRIGEPLEVFFNQMSLSKFLPKENFIFVLPENIDLIDHR
ncbi:MAG: outer membrane lipoprotein carrier protein LolA [Gammaproteobacteria bacterium]|nr:outer membrane lipoprotein carrier protein LolA [Gammaproteobacteria bacterium]